MAPDYAIAGVEDIVLHQMYRAMAFLGMSLVDQTGATPFAPRCTKDLVEEAMFSRHRNLFSGLELVFFDTTSSTSRARAARRSVRSATARTTGPTASRWWSGRFPMIRAGRYREVQPEAKGTNAPAPLAVKEVVVEGRRYVV